MLNPFKLKPNSHRVRDDYYKSDEAQKVKHLGLECIVESFIVWLDKNGYYVTKERYGWKCDDPDWTGSHNYQPVYDKTSYGNEEVTVEKQIYIKHVCTYCGRSIHK